MSTNFADITKAVLNRLDADNTIGLPVVAENDDGGGEDLSNGFLGVSVDFRRSEHASINWPQPRVKHYGTISIAICTPLNEGAADGITIADKLHTLFSGRVFEGINCRVGYVDTKHKISYAKGEFWLTPFVCHFWKDEKLTVA